MESDARLRLSPRATVDMKNLKFGPSAAQSATVAETGLSGKRDRPHAKAIAAGIKFAFLKTVPNTAQQMGNSAHHNNSCMTA